ncbi:uncharacterized protein BDZ99DRAFT_502686 [Mytilinidion resinicola]|uniref:Uncharacterized protein n=1 Tax=Mytilinidion resinicola TaxID=574789 RepID=A0A6A6Y6U3_9PEZI|nr:uncharacterized protein BDZ99DRAFT_502686 [Mytilinidion resinicola]KAF2804243.1 hypothetical protein BDZ99DRAFT_502686 [Mytilinidion resinicola]
MTSNQEEHHSGRPIMLFGSSFTFGNRSLFFRLDGVSVSPMALIVPVPASFLADHQVSRLVKDTKRWIGASAFLALSICAPIGFSSSRTEKAHTLAPGSPCTTTSCQKICHQSRRAFLTQPSANQGPFVLMLQIVVEDTVVVVEGNALQRLEHERLNRGWIKFATITSGVHVLLQILVHVLEDEHHLILGVREIHPTLSPVASAKVPAQNCHFGGQMVFSQRTTPWFSGKSFSFKRFGIGCCPPLLTVEATKSVG